jgi:RNA-binding protein Musashi
MSSISDGSVDPRKIVVLGLPWQTEDATLLSHFTEYGTVEEAQIMRERYTGKSRGFGFVTFSTTAEAQHATTAEHVIDGRRCEAKFALPEGKVGSARTTRIFVARIPSSVSDLQFRAYFEQFGTVQDAYMPKDPSKQGHRGIGFVTYASPDSVEHVMAGTHVLNGNEVAIDRATPKERTQGATLPGRLSMSQPNLHMLSVGGAHGGGSAHGGGAFPAFMRGSAGGLGSGVFSPHSSSYYYGDPSGGRSGGGGGLGSRHMSHPLLPTTSNHFGSPPQHASGISTRGGTTPNQQQQQQYGSSSATNLQAAIQQHLSSNSLSSLDGPSATSTPHQQQLLNLINANVAAAAGGAGLQPPPRQQHQEHQQAAAGGSNNGFPPSGNPSSPNDLPGILLPLNFPSGGVPPSSRAGPRIFVGKLNRETSDQDIKAYFSRFGYVLDVYLPRDKSNKREHRGFGFVTFETEASIQRVVSHVTHYIRGSVIAIDAAVPRQEEQLMVLTIENPAQQQQQQQHMQYHQQPYYPSVPPPPPQQYHQHAAMHYFAPMPVPSSDGGGGGNGGGRELSTSTSNNQTAAGTLQAFEGLSLGQGSVGGAGNTVSGPLPSI